MKTEYQYKTLLVDTTYRMTKTQHLPMYNGQSFPTVTSFTAPHNNYGAIGAKRPIFKTHAHPPDINSNPGGFITQNGTQYRLFGDVHQPEVPFSHYQQSRYNNYLTSSSPQVVTNSNQPSPAAYAQQQQHFAQTSQLMPTKQIGWTADSSQRFDASPSTSNTFSNTMVRI